MQRGHERGIIKVRMRQTRIGKPFYDLASGVEVYDLRLEHPPHRVTINKSLQPGETKKNQEHKRTDHQNNNGYRTFNHLPVTVSNLSPKSFVMAPNFRDAPQCGYGENQTSPMKTAEFDAQRECCHSHHSQTQAARQLFQQRHPLA